MAVKQKETSGYDLMLLLPVILLVGLGLVIVYSSSSYVAALRHFGDSYYYLKRQVVSCIAGLAIMVITKHLPKSFYSILTGPGVIYPLMFINILLLIIIMVPGVGHKVGGATRWLQVAGFSFQPSELAKITLAFYMAYSISRHGAEMNSFSKGFLPHIFVSGIFMGLIVIQPDLGTSVVIGIWIYILMFVGGVRLRHLFSILVLAVPALTAMILFAPYRLRRISAFLDPWQDPGGVGFQITHSFLALGSGGFFGAGLGNSKQKMFYLPEAHTDFALSIAGEELGFIGIVAMVFLFCVLIIRGLKVALDAGDLFSHYLALGLTCLIGLQALINMGVVMGMLPTTGLALPFISYGGTSLVLNLFCVGVLLNISSRK